MQGLADHVRALACAAGLIGMTGTWWALQESLPLKQDQRGTYRHYRFVCVPIVCVILALVILLVTSARK